MAAGQATNLVLTYDITQNTFQTVLQAAVLISTSGRPAARVSLIYVVMSNSLQSMGFVLQALSYLCASITTVQCPRFFFFVRVFFLVLQRLCCVSCGM